MSDPRQQQVVAHDAEGSMARADLYRAAKHAMKLFQMIKDGQQLEGWVQAKITKSADYLDSIYHYMEYQVKFGGGAQASSVQDITAEADQMMQAAEAEEVVDESMTYDQRLRALLESKINKKVAEGMKVGDKRPSATGGTIEKTKTGIKHSAGKNYGGDKSPVDKDEDDKPAKKAVKKVKEGLKDPKDNPCWKGYKPVGTKKKAGKTVPNCVPKESVAEGQGDFAKAINNLHGWYEVDSNNPNIKEYEFDDREGGFYAGGTVEHNLKTGKIKVDFEDRSGQYSGEDIKTTFNSIGDAMNALRTITTPYSYNNGKAQKFDRLARREPVTPDKLRKTDRTGRKGTIGGAHSNDLKYSIQNNKGKLGPKGVLPEQGVAEATKEKEPEGTYSSKRHETDGQRIARLAKEKRQAEKKKAELGK